MSKVLITGASSFLGSYLLTMLRQDDHELVCIRHSNHNMQRSDYQENQSTFLYGDISEKSLWETVPSDIDAVIHLASLCRDHNKSKLQELIRTNILGTINVFEYAHQARVNKIVFSSSVSIYGQPNVQIVDETTAIYNPDLYGLSKLIGESFLRDQLVEIPSVSLRLPAILGKGAHSAWIPRITQQIFSEHDVTIYNPDFQINNIVSALDVANFVVELLRQNFTGNHSFPLACNGCMSINEIVTYIKETLQSKSKIHISPDVAVGSFILDDQYARRIFKYSPSAIETILASYLSQYS